MLVQTINEQKSRLIEECNNFCKLGIWPKPTVIAYRAWLDCFCENELPYAIDLLRGFSFFNEESSIEMLSVCINRAIFHCSLSIENLNSISSVKYCIIGVEAEEDDATASGAWYAGKAKRILAIEEFDILNFKNCQKRLSSDEFTYDYAIFVDDILGSGKQFMTHMNRHLTSDGETLYSALQRINVQIIYAPLVATEYGMKRVAKHFDNILVLPCHTLGTSSSTLSPDYRAWKPELSLSSLAALEEISFRHGFNDIDIDRSLCWKGFHGLGLSIAFHDSVPDLNLRLLSASSKTLTKLIH